MNQLVAVQDVQVGERIRQNIGDVSDLRESIREVGMLQPIVVTPDNRLVAGERRLEACKQEGFLEVEVKVVTNLTTAASLLRAEREENTCRKELTPTEMVASAARLEALLTPEAKERQRESGHLYGEAHPKSEVVARGPQPLPPRVRDQVADALGTSSTTIRRAKEVIEATQSEDSDIREAAQEAQREMDESGRVRTAQQKVRAIRERKGECQPTSTSQRPKLPGGQKRTPKESSNELADKAAESIRTVIMGAYRTDISWGDVTDNREEVLETLRECRRVLTEMIHDLERNGAANGAHRDA